MPFGFGKSKKSELPAATDIQDDQDNAVEIAPDSPSAPAEAEAEARTASPGDADQKEELALLVSIKQASGFQTDDTVAGYYCACKLTRVTYSVTSNSEGAEPSFLLTPAKKVKKDPVWTYDGSFLGFYLGDTIQFTIRRCAGEVRKEEDTKVGKAIVDTNLHPEGFEGDIAIDSGGTVRVKVLPVRRFAVNIISANGLRNADWMGKSDPFCVCEVQGRPETQVQTTVCKETQSPEWNKKIEVDVGMNESLKFTVMDSDWPTGDDTLGTVTLRGEEIADGYDDEAKYDEPSKNAEAKLKIVISKVSPAHDTDAAHRKAAATKLQALQRGQRDRKLVKQKKDEASGGAASEGAPKAAASHGKRGKWASKASKVAEVSGEGVKDEEEELAMTQTESQAALGPLPRASGLSIVIISAENLKGTAEHTPVPVVTCEIHGTHTELFRTKGAGATTDPTWDFVGKIAEVGATDSLDFTVKDISDLANTGEHLLGRSTLWASQFNPGGFNDEVVLSFSGKGKKAKLKIKVTLAKLGITATPKMKPKPTGPWCFLCRLRAARCEKIDKPQDKKQKWGKVQKDTSAAKLAQDVAQAVGANPWTGMDTYATCEIPDKDDTKIVTRVLMNAFAPEWEEVYILRNWKENDPLLLNVIDYEPVGTEDEVLGQVLLPATAFQDEGFKGDIELTQEKPSDYRALLSIEIIVFEADLKQQGDLVVQSRQSFEEFLERKTGRSKVRIEPGEVLRPQIKSVFQRLYQDHSDRQTKRKNAKEIFWESQQKILNTLIESTCKTAPATEIQDISARLFEDGELRRKRRDEWIEKRHEQIIAELRLIPETNSATPGEVEDPDNPRYEQLFNAHARTQTHKEEAREAAKAKEATYMAEHSVHREVPALAAEDEFEIFDRLFGEGYQRENRLAQRIRDQMWKEEDEMFNRRVVPKEEYDQVVAESADRLFKDHAIREERRKNKKEMLDKISTFQKNDGQEEKKKQKGSTTRHQMLYVDSLRRLERQRLMKDRSERDADELYRSMQLHKPPPKTEQANEIDRIFGQLYNPQIRTLSLGQSQEIEKIESDGEEDELDRTQPRKKKTDDTPSKRPIKGKKRNDTDDEDERPSSRTKHTSPSKARSKSKGRDRDEEDELPSRSNLTTPKKSLVKSRNGRDDDDDSTPRTSSRRPQSKSRRGNDDNDRSPRPKAHSKSRRGQDEDDESKASTPRTSARKPLQRQDSKTSSPSKLRSKSGRAHEEDPKARRASPKKSSETTLRRGDSLRAKTPPPPRSSSRPGTEATATRRARSTPTSKDRAKTPDPKKPTEVTMTKEQLARAEAARIAEAERRRKADALLKEKEVDNYTLDGWHPAYRHSLLLRLEPAHRAKVEADLDFRNMMAETPLQEREFCSVCNALFSPDAAFCRRCGLRRENGPEPAQPHVQPLTRVVQALKEKNLRVAEHFSKWDINKNGKISVKEFRKGLDALGLNLHYEDVRKIMIDMDKDGNADGFVGIPEIEKALRKVEREKRQSVGTLFPPNTSDSNRPGRRATVSVPRAHVDDTRENLTRPSPRVARSVTPTRTTSRRTVTGSPQDTRHSLLRHVAEDQLIREEALCKPRTEYVKGDMRASIICDEIPPDFKWDTRPLRLRDEGKSASGAEKSVAREPSGVALEDATVNALKNDDERRFLLALEENVISGVQDSTIDRIELTTPIPKDLQGYVQNLADYYYLQYEVAETEGEETVNMTLLRTPESRVRGISLAKMCEEMDKPPEVPLAGDEAREAFAAEVAKDEAEAQAANAAEFKTSTPRSRASKASKAAAGQDGDAAKEGELKTSTPRSKVSKSSKAAAGQDGDQKEGEATAGQDGDQKVATPRSSTSKRSNSSKDPAKTDPAKTTPRSNSSKK